MTEEIKEKILKKIKKRIGLTDNVKIYDEELTDLIEAAEFDMMEAGVPVEMLEDPNPQVINCIALFVRTERAEDNKTADWYESQYQKTLFRLSLFEKLED